MTYFSGELRFGHDMLTFTVSDAESIALRGSTAKKGFIYAYLYDPQGQIRANILFEKKEKELIISRHSVMPGGFKGELNSGEWQLHLYRLDGENRDPDPLSYSLEIEFDVPPQEYGIPTTPAFDTNNRSLFDYAASKHPATRWYRGDLHAHSTLSDGHNALADIIAIVKQQRLDFFFLTEHNICHPELPQLENTLILPGIEITTDLGHFNVHGPHRGLNMNGAAFSSAELIAQGLDMALGRGNVSINHPMMKPWHWLYRDMPLARVNTMEVCCDPTWSTSPQSTNEALNVLSAMWNAGHRIAAVGGSDAHLAPHERNPNATEPSIYGDPATFVYANGLTGDSILSGLHQGHIYIERRCGLTFTINDGAILPGDGIRDDIVSYQLAVADTTQHYVAECIVDGDCVARYSLSPQPTCFDIDLSRNDWVRIDIRREHNDEFEGLINPVYRLKSTRFDHPTVQTWGELLEAMQYHDR